MDHFSLCSGWFYWKFYIVHRKIRIIFLFASWFWSGLVSANWNLEIIVWKLCICLNRPNCLSIWGIDFDFGLFRYMLLLIFWGMTKELVHVIVAQAIHVFWGWMLELVYMWSCGYGDRTGIWTSTRLIRFWIRCFMSFAIMPMALIMPTSTSSGMNLERFDLLLWCMLL